MYETGTIRSVRAFHVMPGAEGPEGERHAHDYRVEVVVGCAQLDERAMGIDLDVLDAGLREALGAVEEADLDERIRPPGAEAVTVEVFARWIFDQLAEAARAAGGHTLAVRVWESPTAFGGYHAPLRSA
ncbi:MAG: 6-carboxytetrahydropterin synthase [Solirubrobacteraceae bacterium]